MVGLDYHWRKDSFDLLGRVTDLIADRADADLYADYLDYLRLKQQGLRKRALAVLDRFVARYEHEPFEVRHHICWPLVQLTETHCDPRLAPTDWFFPHGIEVKLLRPMFEEWRLREPRNVNAWLYYSGGGKKSGVQTAFELEPQNPRCQCAALQSLQSWIALSVHELEHLGFILDGPEEFSGAVDALAVVARAIGSNLSDEARLTLAWLQALAALHAEVRSDLRPELASRGIVEPEPSFLPIAAWFREPPRLWGR